MKILPLISFLLLSVFSFSQSRREWTQTADEAFKKEDYSTAAYYYLQVLEGPEDGENFSHPYEVSDILLPDKKTEADTAKGAKPAVETKVEISFDNQRIVHNLAECYRQLHDYLNEEKWFARSASIESKYYPDERYWYATALMQNEKYEKAGDEFERYLKARPDKNSPLYKSAQRKNISCNFFAGTSLSKNPATVITELDSAVNAGTASFGAAFLIKKDSIVFASARKQSTAPAGQDPIYFTDVFSIQKKDSVHWGAAKKFAPAVNSTMHESPGFFSENGRNFLFTRWTNGPEKKECAIYLSRYMNGQWLQPMKLNNNVNPEGYKSMHPVTNEDGSILYFSSDRPGGNGKMDLWYAPLNEFGVAGLPVNLGPSINTEENEVTPFYDADSKILYFSSEGHQGLGGLDVFKSVQNSGEGDVAWSNPLNMKAPINSGRDDAYFIAYKDQSIGYFATDRKSCKDCSGGFCYKLYAVTPIPFIITLKGTVYEKKTKKPIVNSLVTLQDASESAEAVYFITDDEGKYSTLLSEEMAFLAKAQKNKYFSDNAAISTKGVKKSLVITQDFYLEKIPSGDIVIPGIEYDFDKATLRPRSMLILDTLSDMLKLNDNLVVELGSHTDSRGNDDYNYRLSEERAKSCVQYLISRGIAKDRLQPKGYGETKLIVSDAEIANMPTEEERETGHQKNRRTALRIVEEKAIRLK